MRFLSGLHPTILHPTGPHPTGPHPTGPEWRVSILVAGLVMVLGCGDPQTRAQPKAPEPVDTRPTLVFLGDSLTRGKGLSLEESYPALLQERFEGAELGYKVVNAGVSGMTTAGGLRRLDWVLSSDPEVLVVLLGGNDGLRGLDVSATESNLDAILTRARERGVEVLLGQMRMPPNYGPTYTENFAALYPRLAEKHGIDLLPFPLEGVAGIESYNQEDGIHPDAAGHRKMARILWPPLKTYLEAYRTSRTSPRS